MKKLPASLVFLLLVLSLGCFLSITAQETAPPICIDSEDDFLGMSHNGVYCLSQDITLTSPWESGDMAFCGTLDGGGHTVTLLGVPMFARFSGKLKNVWIEGSVGEECAAYPGGAGAVACSISGGAEFSDIELYVDVYADGPAGGIAGSAVIFGDSTETEISFHNCRNNRNLQATGDFGYAGGMVGRVEGGITLLFLACVNAGEVAGDLDAGGICGSSLGKGIRAEGCLNTGTVISCGGSAGGIVGQVDGGKKTNNDFRRMIINCENRALVSTASGQAGGIVGYITAGMSVRLCTNSGSISGAPGSTGVIAGGILGKADGGVPEISECENRGSVSASRQAGGIVGYVRGDTASVVQCDIEYCYNYADISSVSSNAGGIVGHCSASGDFICARITCSGNYGNISTANGVAGGIVGYVTKSDQYPYIEYCFNAGGDVTATTCAAGLLGYCYSDKVVVRGCYAFGGLLACETAANPTCAVLWNKSTSTHIENNFFPEGYADCFAYQNNEEQPFMEEFYFSHDELVSGGLAYRMNKTLASEVFRQNIDTTTPDPCPTTNKAHGQVFVNGCSEGGELHFGNRELIIQMLHGASVRLNSTSGIRFTSQISAGDIEYAGSLSDAGTEPSFGTLIVPTDYITTYRIEKLDINGLHGAGFVQYNFTDLSQNTNPDGLYYVNIPAERGIVLGTDGGATVNAALVNLTPAAYRREFSAVSYIKYTSGGVDYYVFSHYSPTANSRSIEQVAYRALCDVSPTENQTEGYIYLLPGGEYSRYRPAAREVLDGFLTSYSVSVSNMSGYALNILSGGIGEARYGSVLCFSVDTNGQNDPVVIVNGELAQKDLSGHYTITVFGNVSIGIYPA